MKSIEKFFDMSMGVYSGVLVREKKAQRLARLLYKHNQEVKEMLASDLSDLEVSNWTLAHPDGKQTTVRYYTPSSDEEKMRRVNLINKDDLMKYCEDGVFIADSMKDAEEVYMDWHEKTHIE